MQKTKILPRLIRQVRPVRPRNLQQAKCSVHIGANEIVRPENRAIHVALRRKVNHRPRTVALEQIVHQIAVANISLHKLMPRVFRQAGQVPQIPRISELVEVDDWSAFLRPPLQDEVGANESSSAGDQDRAFHGTHLIVIKKGRESSSRPWFTTREAMLLRAAAGG